MGVVGAMSGCGGGNEWVWWGQGVGGVRQGVGVVGAVSGCGGGSEWVWWGQ